MPHQQPNRQVRRAVDKRKYFNQIGYTPYDLQEEFHSSNARFKIVVAGRRAGKSTSAARDMEPELLLPNRRYWIVAPTYDLGEREFRVIWNDMIVGLQLGKDKRVKKAYNKCVDTETKILTQRGWLSHKEVRVGDETLSINPATGLSEWDTVEAVHIYPGEHEVVEWSGRTFSAVTTPEHRWFVRKNRANWNWRWKTTSTLARNDQIPRALPCSTLPTDPKYTDAFVELVAWLWTEGSQEGNTLSIGQSFKIHPENCVRIQRALMEMCPEPIRSRNSWKPAPYWSVSEKFSRFYIGKVLSEPLLEVFSKHKVVKPEFIRSLTTAQLQLFVDVSVLGDGHQHEERTTNVGQENEEQLFALQLACALLGIATSIIQRQDGYWRLNIQNDRWATPVASMLNANNEGRLTETKQVISSGVWCVTTKNGTWFARRDGKTYFTGNSMGNMYVEFPWGTRVEVRTSQHPENLVGEGLHGAIMAEAAKLHEDTWERYVRPALADYHGWGTFSSTPEGQNYLYKLWKYGRDPDPSLKDYAAWRFPSWANKSVYPGGREDPEIKLLELTTSPEWFAQEIGAEFTAFVGRIYNEFDEQIHVKDVKYNPNLKSYAAFDFGWTNPFVCLEFQVDTWDNIYVWREHYKSHTTVPDHIAILNAREQPAGYRPPDLGFGDAADPEAAAQITQLNFCLVVTDSKAKENWREGIELVKMFLKEYETGRQLDEFGTPEHKPKLFIDHSCKDLIYEFNNYQSMPPPRKAAAGRSPREAPKKEHDHGLDALRYGLMHLYKLGAQHHLTETMSAKDMIPSEVSNLSNTESLAPSTTSNQTSYFNTGMEF